MPHAKSIKFTLGLIIYLIVTACSRTGASAEELPPSGRAVSAQQELEPLFHASLDFYGKLQRTPNGLYLDAYHVDRGSRPNHHCSIAAVGVGLIALCIDHEIGRDPGAKQKALQTLRAVNGKLPGFHPDREKSGFFGHFFSSKDGSGRSEHSTIDTAILVVGALFCRNSFDDPQIAIEADALWNSIDWEIALASPNGDRLHMVIENGKPRDKTKTQLFNEYYILAWLIKESQLEMTGRSQVITIGQLPSWDNHGLTLLSDRRHKPQCSFIVQFPYYMCHPCTTDPRYRRYVEAQAEADQRACAQRVDVEAYWGCGAGGTPNDGYRASDYVNNPDNLVSPPIIAGFMPASQMAQKHLVELYRDPKLRLKTPVGNLLPRFSVDKPDWRPRRIESIDFASMLFGLAGIDPRLGMEFFQVRSKFSFNR